MNKKSVSITGLGTVSAAGRNLERSLESMGSRRTNGSLATLFSTSLKYHVFEASSLPEKYYLEGQRTLSLALCAVDEALRDAGLEDIRSGSRVGVCLGTTVASQLNDKEFYFGYRDTGSAPMHPVDRYLKGEISEYIFRKVAASGLSLTVVNACSSGSDAIGVALSWLQNGIVDIAIAGGSDELNHIPLCGFGSLGILSTEPCRPFDKNRNGLNLGEGAGIMVLETAESAGKRGENSLLSLAGYGSSSDAYHLTAPRPDGAGLKRAIEKAIADAGISPADIGFINAHGTATSDNDKVEGKVFREIFGAKIKILSTKGYTGHTLGAAGGIEAVFTAAALRDGWLPPSVGFKTYDEEIGIAPLSEKTDINAEFALSTSLAFGGNNAALVIRLGN